MNQLKNICQACARLRDHFYRFPETLAAAAMALVQLGLGIATILSGINIGLATAHQAGAVLLLTLLIVVRHRATPSRQGPDSAMVGG